MQKYPLYETHCPEWKGIPNKHLQGIFFVCFVHWAWERDLSAEHLCGSARRTGRCRNQAELRDRGARGGTGPTLMQHRAPLLSMTTRRDRGPRRMILPVFGQLCSCEAGSIWGKSSCLAGMAANLLQLQQELGIKLMPGPIWIFLQFRKSPTAIQHVVTSNPGRTIWRRTETRAAALAPLLTLPLSYQPRLLNVFSRMGLFLPMQSESAAHQMRSEQDCRTPFYKLRVGS